MNQIIMWIMAVGAVLGGVDRIAGNRFGLGKRFEEGFTLLGPTALSMSGIICLTPLLSRFLRFALVPIWNFLGLDDNIFFLLHFLYFFNSVFHEFFCGSLAVK